MPAGLQTIELHREAPAKPAHGESCNGCGVCCAMEPCPVAHVFLLQRKGRCRALVWQEADGRYACGMVLQPDRYSFLVPAFSRRWMKKFFASRIAAGAGCDAGIEMEDAWERFM